MMQKIINPQMCPNLVLREISAGQLRAWQYQSCHIFSDDGLKLLAETIKMEASLVKPSSARDLKLLQAREDSVQPRRWQGWKYSLTLQGIMIKNR